MLAIMERPVQLIIQAAVHHAQAYTQQLTPLATHKIRIWVKAYLDVRILLFEVAASACDGATCSYSSNQDVDFALRVFPDLWASAVVVDLGVIGVLKLLKDVGIGRCCCNLFCLVDSSFHTCKSQIAALKDRELCVGGSQATAG